MPDKRKEGVSSSKKSSSKRTKVEETETESLSYDPVHFIRSHSKNNDPADIQTQVSYRMNLLMYASILICILKVSIKFRSD
jgi:hypothetical protein